MRIKLRGLLEKDAPYMIEWMHDSKMQEGFKKNMMSYTLEDAMNFCKESMLSEELHCGDSLHFAIVEENDEYLGTISLKNVDVDNGTAEYAIITREKAQGKGVALAATYLILKKAFFEYNLHRVFLSVYADNLRAIRLYERAGFVFEGEFREHLIKHLKRVNWRWYGMLKEEFDEDRFVEVKGLLLK